MKMRKQHAKRGFDEEPIMQDFDTSDPYSEHFNEEDSHFDHAEKWFMRGYLE
ncbi:hypothetical protein KY349_01770 [Candidatus Woesearchaeota archaeon]|jgi:hypothetical protein|nr:hypothetical protein [Candidatus Woesearchaeota archaeon]